jgi:LPS sulfotransferase NodH
VAEAGWDSVLADQAVHGVRYQALVDDPVATVRGVLEWLDVPGATEVVVSPPPTRRQADAETLRWRERWAAGD